MKKLLLATLVAGSISYAYAYGTAGCGLGSMVIGDKPGFNQIFASTLNGSSGSQTFGMTSGTSNCGENQELSKDENLAKFIQTNMDEIAFDISKGNGEYLDTMASYLKTDSAILGKKLKTNFNTIYTKDDIKVSELMNNIQKVLNS